MCNIRNVHIAKRVTHLAYLAYHDTLLRVRREIIHARPTRTARLIVENRPGRFPRRYEQSARFVFFFFLFLLHPQTIRRGIPKEVGGVKTNWIHGRSPCARLAGSINRVVRYISHPAVRSAHIPTLYLRGVGGPAARLAARAGEDTRLPLLQSRPTDLRASGSRPYPTAVFPTATLRRPIKDATPG